MYVVYIVSSVILSMMIVSLALVSFHIMPEHTSRQTYMRIRQSIVSVSNSKQVYSILNSWCTCITLSRGHHVRAYLTCRSRPSGKLCMS